VGALAGLGIAYAKSGDQTAARKIIQEMESLSKRSYVSPIYIGIVYGALGERNQEFDLYAKAYEDRSEYLLWLTLDPLFDHVRSDSRFAELAKESRSRPLRVSNRDETDQRVATNLRKSVAKSQVATIPQHQ
jgi:hypothetical protein